VAREQLSIQIGPMDQNLVGIFGCTAPQIRDRKGNWVPATTNTAKIYRMLLRAPCKGTVFQWVRIPPGNCRSSRKQSEQPWR
jgi:hypothetical protein